MSESLKDEIGKVSREATDIQNRIKVIVGIFEKENIDFHSRESAITWHRAPLYDEMTYLERNLGLAQQRLASLLLQSVKESTTQLDASVGTLHSSTETLVKFSLRLEFLTSLLFLVAAVSVVETAEIAILPKDQLLLVSILSLVAIGFMFAALWTLLRKTGSLKELV